MTDHQSSGAVPPVSPKSGGFIPGLIKGLATTARTFATPTHTAEYPDVKPHLPPRTKGVIALLEENCTSCMLCSRECPDWCIYIDSHKETLPATTEGGRERQRNVLDRFAIDFSLCMYCGICIEVCPFDALHWSPEFEYAEFDILNLMHEKERLGQWMATVPPPQALDPSSAEPAEITAANKPARPVKPAGDRPARPVKPAGDRPERAARPAVDKPAVDQTVVSEPVTEQTVVSEPVADQTVVSEPVTDQTVVSEPVTDQTVVSEPVTDPPAAEKPAPADPTEKA